jgi:signal transduction histidine kinase
VDKLEELRAHLLTLLNQTPIDFGKVLELSTNLSRLDPDFVRFSVDAGHISRLGRELVGRKETAVSELVKNAYDADATYAKLQFINASSPNGRLIVNDDGLGMDRNQLIDGFMRISTTDKIHNPVSLHYERQRAGRKGIGRFASQRIGTKLTLVTQTKDDTNALRMVIDWDEFEQDKDLSSFAGRVEIVPKEREQGTTLIIENLRDTWTDTEIKRVYGYITDLIQPYPLSKESKKKKNDPGFKATFCRISGNSEWIVADEKVMILNYAVATIEADVDHDGYGHWSFKSTRLNLKEESNPINPSDKENGDQPYPRLRNIKLKVHYFIQLSEFIPSQLLVSVRETLRVKGGIRVYRNGFRVLPYGEMFNDWLRLDASTRAREILPAHANNSFIGFVELKDLWGGDFDETSGREGLIENDVFNELVDFVSRSLKSAVLRIAAVREKKQTAHQRTWEPKKATTPTEKLRETAQNLEIMAAKAGLPSEEVKTTKQAARELFAIAVEQEKQTENLLEEIAMLRILSSLGLTIGQFVHESKNMINVVSSDLSLIKAALQNDNPTRFVNRMSDNLAILYSYTGYFDKAVSDNVIRDRRLLEIRDVVSAFVNVTKPIASGYGISILEPEIIGYDLFTKPLHPSELSSILFNLFTNAKKAIKKANIRDGKIMIRAGRENDYIYLEFTDNGIGIPIENREKIFDAFFTTSNLPGPAADDQEELIGTGLGLKIVKDIVTASNGDIKLINPPSDYKTCFKITLPAASEEEIKEYED